RAEAVAHGDHDVDERSQGLDRPRALLVGRQVLERGDQLELTGILLDCLQNALVCCLVEGLVVLRTDQRRPDLERLLGASRRSPREYARDNHYSRDGGEGRAPLREDTHSRSTPSILVTRSPPPGYERFERHGLKSLQTLSAPRPRMPTSMGRGPGARVRLRPEREGVRRSPRPRGRLPSRIRGFSTLLEWFFKGGNPHRREGYHPRTSRCADGHLAPGDLMARRPRPSSACNCARCSRSADPPGSSRSR